VVLPGGLEGKLPVPGKPVKSIATQQQEVSQAFSKGKSEFGCHGEPSSTPEGKFELSLFESVKAKVELAQKPEVVNRLRGAREWGG
jgi:hypothetical protein